jgi:hypothetical protein
LKTIFSGPARRAGDGGEDIGVGADSGDETGTGRFGISGCGPACTGTRKTALQALQRARFPARFAAN